jgi:hypothetical protein
MHRQYQDASPQLKRTLVPETAMPVPTTLIHQNRSKLVVFINIVKWPNALPVFSEAVLSKGLALILHRYGKEGLLNDVGVASPLACSGVPLLANAPELQLLPERQPQVDIFKQTNVVLQGAPHLRIHHHSLCARAPRHLRF